jgi:hypothetical protein
LQTGQVTILVPAKSAPSVIFLKSIKLELIFGLSAGCKVQ